jgi:ribosomal protein S18 acetylase RimI-like enzyme
LAGSLATRAIVQAKSIVEEVTLTVLASNKTAIRLYEDLGFEVYGLERRALKVGYDYHDQLLIALSLIERG